MRFVAMFVVLTLVVCLAPATASHSSQDSFSTLTQRMTPRIVLVEMLNDHAARLAVDEDFVELQALLDIIDEVIATTNTGIYDDEGNLRDSCIWIPLTAENCTSDCGHENRYWTTWRNYQDALDAYYMCSQFSFHALCESGYVPTFTSQCDNRGLRRCSSAWSAEVHFCDAPPYGGYEIGCQLEQTCADVICEPECWGGVPFAPNADHPYVRK